MIGVIVNAVTSSLAAVIGVGLKNRISERFTTPVLWVIALGLAAMGIQGAVQSQNMLLVLASMIIGTVLGTAIRIEDRMNQFGEFLKKHLSRGDDSKFVKGFVTLSMMETIGAMAIIGPIQAALGSNDLLYFKSAIDAVSSFIFGALYGLGVVPVGIVLFVYETIFYVLATFLLPLMTPDVVRELNAVGCLMILAIALNLLQLTKFKVADFLPALFIPIIYYSFLI
ncbi:MAG: DUF554 domain-containing protein [Megasphaera massiliensis]|uniref:DUF554 domain-containing protein n=1 Tax=Megasphaera massiliensis TaxID=1232428 RepID=UPI00210B2857|nr:DUF554 domain-containing protein [Megasphaera massiliensis]MCQ5210027.1 DUF554 domain-containing protein [Megasphaera massiliensis]MEE0658714.1 DUF554 domain-containing protein [Megasphaera massiliensis]